MSKPRKFRKKPVVIEAMRFTDHASGQRIREWARSKVYYGCLSYEWMCETLEGPLLITEGDWVIKGIQGEFYPCNPTSLRLPMIQWRPKMAADKHVAVSRIFKRLTDREEYWNYLKEKARAEGDRQREHTYQLLGNEIRLLIELLTT